MISERRGAMVSVTKASRTSSLSTTSTAPMYKQGNDFLFILRDFGTQGVGVGKNNCRDFWGGAQWMQIREGFSIVFTRRICWSMQHFC